jgi:hypothetical protein
VSEVREKRSYLTSSKSGFRMTQKSEMFYHSMARVSGLWIVFEMNPAGFKQFFYIVY